MRWNPDRSERIQQSIGYAIVNLTGANGYPPTLSELTTNLSMKRSTVRRHLLLMRDAGVVTWNEGQFRTLKVVG